jgi:seryl-tRNA synthetase
MVTRATMIGTGQLPKFEEDAYKVDPNTFLFPPPKYRLPTCTGIRSWRRCPPIRHCAFSACFRSEAGSAGRDTRGLIRQHQFNKWKW